MLFTPVKWEPSVLDSQNESVTYTPFEQSVANATTAPVFLVHKRMLWGTDDLDYELAETMVRYSVEQWAAKGNEIPGLAKMGWLVARLVVDFARKYPAVDLRIMREPPGLFCSPEMPDKTPARLIRFDTFVGRPDLSVPTLIEVATKFLNYSNPSPLPAEAIKEFALSLAHIISCSS